MKYNSDLDQIGKQMELFSQEASRVNHTPQQENDSERKTSATCGPKCLELFGSFNQNTLWAKTFAGLLVGQEGWYSKRCGLTWKLLGTKYNRLYFQLQASTLHTSGSEFGLLPTPTTRDWKGARSSEALQAAGRTNTNSLSDFYAQPGKTSQLNPQFVLEMMGFPSDWSLLPFQNGETKASRQQETQ
jgi:hypothetical protein